MRAHSPDTGKSYENWDALVEAEANGYTVVAIIATETQSWPWVTGPYPNQYEAKKAQARMRHRLRKEQDQYPDRTFSVFTRPLWKEQR